MNYTKGIWERHNASNGEHIWVGKEHIADFDGINANADAKLCVAAPDMYEAIQNFLNGFAVWHNIDPDKSPNTLNEFVKPLRKALAKAEGKVK